MKRLGQVGDLFGQARRCAMHTWVPPMHTRHDRTPVKGFPPDLLYILELPVAFDLNILFSQCVVGTQSQGHQTSIFSVLHQSAIMRWGCEAPLLSFEGINILKHKNVLWGIMCSMENYVEHRKRRPQIIYVVWSRTPQILVVLLREPFKNVLADFVR